MTRRPPTSTLFPYTTLFRSSSSCSCSVTSCIRLRGLGRTRRFRREPRPITTKLTAARTTRNKARGHEIPNGRSGRDREEDSTSNVPDVVDSRPALSTAFTQTWWGPLDRWNVTLVAVPTDTNGPPSMLTSCLAIPEAASEAAQEIVTSDCVTRPLGEGDPRVGALRSTRMDSDFIASMWPVVSMDCHCKE